MKRRQLTLFLDKTESKVIESVRQRFNPLQYELIKSHITLCREDEIEGFEVVERNLANLTSEVLELPVGELKRFSAGKGVLISIQDEEQLFQKLRARVLHNENTTPREHKAHITLMHPRNSTCTDAIFKEILKAEFPKVLSIGKISLIEQGIGKKWKTLKEYKLSNSN